MLPILLAGCWNYIDVDTQFVVLGVIIDKEDDEFVMYTEVSKAKGGAEAKMVTRIESARGKTMFETLRNASLKTGSKMYWGHAMTYIISEKAAKESIAEALNFLSGQTQIRSDIYLLICEDKSVKKIFTFEDPIHEDVSQHLYELLETYEASGKISVSPLYIALQELASSEMSLMLPIIKMEQSDIKNSSATGEQESSSGSTKGQIEEILVPNGSGIFIKDKMIDKLTKIETRSALILKKKLTKGYILATEESEKTPACSVEVINSNISIDPHVTHNDELQFDINLEIDGDLVELISKTDYITTEKNDELSNAIEGMLEKELMALIQKTQDVGSDICGFAGITHRKIPAYWKKNQDNWKEVYKEAKFDISVDINIDFSALSANPIKVGR